MGFGYSNLNIVFNGGITPGPGQGGMSEDEVKKLIQEELETATAEINKSIVEIETEVSSIEAANKAQDESILGLESDVEDISIRLTNIEKGGSGINEEAVKAIIEEQLNDGGVIHEALEEATLDADDVVRVATVADLPEVGREGTLYIVDDTDSSYHWSPESNQYDVIANASVAVDEEGNIVPITPITDEDISNILK